MDRGSVRFLVYSALWVAVALTGVFVQAGADAISAEAMAGPRFRPNIPELKVPEGVPLVIMAIHPRCPCSPASIDELRALRARLDPLTHVAILICTPAEAPGDSQDGAPTEWDDAFARMVARFDRETVIRDREGVIAASLGMHTSGATLMYDATGHLSFAGGLTLARGMAGANPVAVTASDSLGGATPVCTPQASSPVFGCKLIAPDHAPRETPAK